MPRLDSADEELAAAAAVPKAAPRTGLVMGGVCPSLAAEGRNSST